MQAHSFKLQRMFAEPHVGSSVIVNQMNVETNAVSKCVHHTQDD